METEGAVEFVLRVVAGAEEAHHRLRSLPLALE